MQWNAYVVRWWYAIIILFKIEFSTRMNLNHLKKNFFISMSSTTAYARNNKFNEQEFFNFLFFKSWKSWNDFLLHERFQPSQCWMMRKKQLSINYLPSVEAMHDTKQLLIQLCMRQCLNTPERITHFVDFVFRGKVHSFSHIIVLPANNMQCFLFEYISFHLY